MILTIIILLNFSCVNSQDNKIDQNKFREDLDQIITDLSQNYIYQQEKSADLNCIREYYEKQFPNRKTEEQTVPFFEYLFDEFYNSNLILNANRNSSFRLYSPKYVTIENGKPIISNVWQTQIENLEQNYIGAELLKINGTDVN